MCAVASLLHLSKIFYSRCSKVPHTLEMCIYIQSGLIVGSIKKLPIRRNFGEGGVEWKVVKAMESITICGFTALE
jgi:hypothetical protein